MRHPLPPQNIVYKRLFGEGVTTEIAYMLPGLRFESIRGSTHRALGLTAITPIDDGTTEVHQFFWMTHGWVAPFKPVFQHLMRVFLDQDRTVAVRQREGLVHAPQLMLINDADTQARWWMRVKRAFLDAQAKGEPFVNPVQPMTLRWRS